MKKILPCFLFLFLSTKLSFAGILSPFADTFITLELSKPVLSRNEVKTDLKNQNDFLEGIRQFEDIAIGGHIRFGKFLGFNLNWSQSNLKNHSVAGVNKLESPAKYKSDQINTTALFYLPIIPTRADLFIETGIVDIGSKLKYTTNGGARVEKKSHETMFLYGIGAQISPFGGDFIRLSLHRYAGKIGLIDSNYTTIRLGYLKSF
jgi:hypothetical protein